MEILGKLIPTVIIFFIMMVPGIILRKCRLASDDFGKGISNLVLYVAQPTLILCAYLDYRGDGHIWLNALWVLLGSTVVHFLFAGVALSLFRRAEDGRRRMLRLATVFANAAFMGIPLIREVLGPEATIYASIYNITFNIFLWSLGVYFCTVRRDEDGDGIVDGEIKRKPTISPLKVMLHPVNIASAIGILCLALGIGPYLPEVLTDSFTSIGNLVAPLSMVVIGLRLATTSFRGAFRDRYLYLFLGLRHFILPLAVLLLLRLVAFVYPLGETVDMVILLLAAAPAASSATMFAEKYDCDTAYISRAVVISTLLALVSMPLIVLAYGLVF